MVAFKHLINVKTRSLEMPFRELFTFQKIEKRVSKAALVGVSDVDYRCF